MREKILELKHVSKRFAGVLALDDVSIDIERGEVHAIVGENGAGKSTLIKIITGAHDLTSGEIWFENKKITNNSPALSKALGIGVIYQEFNLMPHLTVSENIFFGRELKKGFILDKEEMDKACKKMISELGVDLNPKSKVGTLSVASQQIVEIVKAVSQDIKFLIMDEPTAPLTNAEIDKLFEIIERLRNKGVSILYISHRLEEVFRMTDRITVLRDGKHVATMKTSDTDRATLIKHMVGCEIGQDYPKRTAQLGGPKLEIKNFCNKKIHDCSLTLYKGEILGIAGLVGAGRTELARAIFGADPISSGSLWLDGKEIKIKNPKSAIDYGIGLIPEDRKTQGLLLNKSIDFNVVYANLKDVSKNGYVIKSKEAEITDKYSKAMNLKAYSYSQLARTLSGGNQQKVVLAKWLATKCSVLIFDEPTRGIDVGAKQEIYEIMCNLVKEGKSIIMISSEMPELIGMSDRVVVMRDGYIRSTLCGSEITQENILDYAAQ